MKKMRQTLFVLFVISLITVGVVTFDLKVTASSYDDSGLVVSGSHVKVNTNELENKEKKTNVTFTFKTTDVNYKGFVGGSYVVKYDADRMDIDASTIKQQGRISGVNTNYTTFQVNGVQGQRGMILVEFSSAVPSQDFDLTMSCTNLFKDNNKDPLKIDIINRQEDPFIVMDINDAIYTPLSPIIKSATITLANLKINLSGEEKIERGAESIYKATVTNFISNDKVNWSIVGANSALTMIDQNGNLKVGNDETATSLKVVATSQEDINVVESKTITVLTTPLIGVSISGSQQLIKGTKNNVYKSNITNSTNQSVSWSLSGNTSANTVVDQKGNITVGVDELASDLLLKATSQEDTTCSNIKTIHLIDKTYTISQIKLKTTNINMDTTQNMIDLKEQVSINKSASVSIVTNDGETYIIEVPISKYTFNENISKNEVLLDGKYKVIYHLKLPFMQVDHNGYISINSNQTNIIGENITQIPLTITKKTVTKKPSNEENKSTISNRNQLEISNDKEKVKTSDSNDIMTNFIVLTSSLILFVISKSRKVEKRKNEIK